MVNYLKGQHDQMSMRAIKLNTILKLNKNIYILFEARKNITNRSVPHALQYRFDFPENKNKTATTQKTIDDYYSLTIAVTHYFRSDKMIKMQIFSR